ncbi:MAG TPA: alpha-amylase family glycosyl hydrolase [Candidatus Xenobia bacterium]|nr:alpha-amylase family glycosyl hydrolase [Candidatus Xenobia bacterium]
MTIPANPLLYEINTRVWLGELAQERPRRGRQAKSGPLSLAQVPPAAVKRIAGLGFDLVWMMGVWQTGALGEQQAREFVAAHPEITGLADFTPDDVGGSPYAVQEYKAHSAFGGPTALAALREQLAKQRIGLLLDFVPNHTALDHPWVSRHPEFYVQGTEEDLENDKHSFFAVETAHGRRILAHGRDPYFPAWRDTAQLNYQHPGLRAAMIQTLLEIAEQCDGVRCDMAMLDLQDVFARTWGERAQPGEGKPAEGEFWAEAIDAVRGKYPRFLFLAEAYWGLEPRLQALGFDYTYDKTLYDHLVHHGGREIRDHLRADPEVQMRSARFLENHDEPRAARQFPLDKHRAAAVLTYTLPGMRLFHEGQLEGRTHHVPMQLRRRPAEPVNEELQKFYGSLLRELRDPALRQGHWKLLEPRPAWEGNPTWEQFVVHRWAHPEHGAHVVAVNYGPAQAQCHVPLQLHRIGGRKILLRDKLSDAVYERDGDSLIAPGLFLDMAPYQAHLFEVGRA